MPGVSRAQDCTTDARRIVDAVYRQVLERGENGEGTSAVNQLSTGQTTVRELVRNAAQSREHAQRFMAGDRRSGVTYAYRHLLGREPDPGGLEAHVRVLETENPSAVIDAIVDSAEYQQLYSDDTVPGAKLRYCGAGAATSTSMRFRDMDRNGNGVIERGEWNGSRAVLHRPRLERRRFAVTRGSSIGWAPGRPGAARRTTSTPTDRPRGPRGTSGCSIATADNRVTSSEWYCAPEYFRRADRDRNGSLTLAEFTGGAGAWDDDREESFDTLDANNNGRIERSEWHGSLDAFQWLDLNRDNALSRLEVVGQTTGQQTGQQQGFDSFVSLDYNRNNALEFPEWRWSRRSFDNYDTNRDGRLTRQEFDAKGGAPATAAR